MMTRLILTICMMMTLLMPCAWAEENATSSQLSQITIETEDWIDGDTYYIRYTFTNPTDKKINETIARTFIAVDAASNTSFSQTLLKEDDEEWQLSIAPHSSSSHTTMFPIEPSYIHFSHDRTVFRLSNGNSLWYTWCPLDTPSPAEITTRFKQTTLNKGYLSITITNRSSASLTSMYHLNIYTTMKKTDNTESKNAVEIITSLPDSFSLDLSPNERKTIQTVVPLPTFPNAVYSPYQVLPSFEIDNILYKYSRYKKTFIPFQRYIYYNSIPNTPSDRSYCHIPITGHMEVIDDTVVYYLTIQNNGKSIYVLRNMGMAMKYVNDFNTGKALYCSLSFEENPITIRPDETKYYRLDLPLLTDTPQQTLDSTTVFGKEDSLYDAFDRNPKISPSPLHSMQKVLYEPLRYDFNRITTENRSILTIR